MADVSESVVRSILEEMERNEPGNGDKELKAELAAAHHQGTCNPCAHNWKAGGCFKGADCNYCHSCLEKDFLQKRRLHRKNKLSRSTLQPGAVGQADAEKPVALSSNSSNRRGAGPGPSEPNTQTTGRLPSAGSANHALGLCRPCAHSWKPGSCSKGADCAFCHLCGQAEFVMYRKQRKSAKDQWRSALGLVPAQEAAAGGGRKHEGVQSKSSQALQRGPMQAMSYRPNDGGAYDRTCMARGLPPRHGRMQQGMGSSGVDVHAGATFTGSMLSQWSASTGSAPASAYMPLEPAHVAMLNRAPGAGRQPLQASEPQALPWWQRPIGADCPPAEGPGPRFQSFPRP